MPKVFIRIERHRLSQCSSQYCMDSPNIRLLAHHGPASAASKVHPGGASATKVNDPCSVYVHICTSATINAHFGLVSLDQAASFALLQGSAQDISEVQLIELRRQWAESHTALAQRSKRDRDEIERLTQLLHQREQLSLQQFRAAADGSSATVPAVQVGSRFKSSARRIRLAAGLWPCVMRQHGQPLRQMFHVA